MDLRIAGILKESVVDGPGLRMVIFAQGCFHHCAGCHNVKTHDPMAGKIISTDEAMNMIHQARLIRGVTFSGGEPFLQAAPLAYLGKKIKASGLNLFTYSGYVFEQLLAMSADNPAIKDLLYTTDVLVDGPFVLEKRDLRLAFRGSTNQRLIDVALSLRSGRAVLWSDEAVCNSNPA